MLVQIKRYLDNTIRLHLGHDRLLLLHHLLLGHGELHQDLAGQQVGALHPLPGHGQGQGRHFPDGSGELLDGLQGVDTVVRVDWEDGSPGVIEPLVLHGGPGPEQLVEVGIVSLPFV